MVPGVCLQFDFIDKIKLDSALGKPVNYTSLLMLGKLQLIFTFTIFNLYITIVLMPPPKIGIYNFGIAWPPWLELYSSNIK